MHASKTHASTILPLASEDHLQTSNKLLCNSCIFHCTNKNFPFGWEDMATAVFPIDESSLYCTFLIQWIAPETGFNCARVKTDSFQNSPPLASSITAYICPEEHEVVWTTYRDSMQDSLILTSHFPCRSCN